MYTGGKFHIWQTKIGYFRKCMNSVLGDAQSTVIMLALASLKRHRSMNASILCNIYFLCLYLLCKIYIVYLVSNSNAIFQMQILVSWTIYIFSNNYGMEQRYAKKLISMVMFNVRHCTGDTYERLSLKKWYLWAYVCISALVLSITVHTLTALIRNTNEPLLFIAVNQNGFS